MCCNYDDPDPEPLEMRAVQCLAEIADALGVGDVPETKWTAALEVVRVALAEECQANPGCPECCSR